MREKTVAIPTRCRRPRCTKAVYSRGLCASDYSTAYRLVVEGLTSWEELERKGKSEEHKRTAKVWLLS